MLTKDEMREDLIEQMMTDPEKLQEAANATDLDIFVLFAELFANKRYKDCSFEECAWDCYQIIGRQMAIFHDYLSNEVDEGDLQDRMQLQQEEYERDGRIN